MAHPPYCCAVLAYPAMATAPQHLIRLHPKLARFVCFWALLALLGGDLAALGANLTISGDTTVDLGFGAVQSVTGGLTGSGNLLETGDGFLVLGGTGMSNFLGTITVNGGALVVSGSGQLGAATNDIAVTGYNNYGYTGGMLVLDGGASGLTIQQDITVSGKGSGPQGGNAVLAIGNNTLSGALTLGANTTTQLGAVYGNTTLAGPVEIGLGNQTYLWGSGNVIMSGSLSSFEQTPARLTVSAGQISNSLWLQNTNNSLLSLTLNNLSRVRVSDGRALGSDPLSILTLQSSGSAVLEIRADAATLASGTSNFASRNITLSSNQSGYHSVGSTSYIGTHGIYVDRAIGGNGISQTVTLGSLAVQQSGLNLYFSASGRNGYGVTAGTVGGNFGVSNQLNINNNSNGLLTLNGNATLTPSYGYLYSSAINATSDINWNGDLLRSGSVELTSGDFLSKNGLGILYLKGTASTLKGTTFVNNGILQINSFGAINNTDTTGAISLGAGANVGALNFVGSVGEATAKLVLLAGTAGSGILQANQTSGTLNFTAGVANSSTSGGTLVLGGNNAGANTISGIISNGSAGATTSIFKTDTGTWVYAPTSTVTRSGPGGITGTGTLNAGTLLVSSTAGISVGMSVSAASIPSGTVVTAINGGTVWLSNVLSSPITNGSLSFGNLSNFSGNLTLTGGTLRFAAPSNSADLIADSATLLFGADNVAPGSGRQTAGGRFEWTGFDSGSNETFDTLTAAAGQAIVGVTTGTLTINNLGARNSGAALDFQPGTGSITFGNFPGSTGGIIGGWATLNGVDFVTPTVTAISYQEMVTSGGTSTKNYLLTGGTTTTAAVTINALKLAGSGTLTLGGSLSLKTGGLLFDNSTGASTITGNTLFSTSGEIIVTTNGTTPTNALTLTSSITSGSGSLTKNGTGLLIISGTNNIYTGDTVLNGGTLRLSGPTATLGAPTANTATVIRQDAVLDINGAGTSTTVYSGGTFSLFSLGTLSGAGRVDNSSGTATLISLGSSNTTGTSVFSGIISGSLGVVRNGSSGNVFLTGINTYTGPTILSGSATLGVTSLANGGSASSIGASSNAASNLVFNGGQLYYTGTTSNIFALATQTASVATDRLFTLAGNASIDSSGRQGSNTIITANNANNATLAFTNAGSVAFAGTGTRTLNLTGTSTGDNEIHMALVNNGTSALSVTKNGGGLWLLTGTNTYTGNTTVSQGVLQAQDGVGLPTASNLSLSGVFQSSGVFSRALGTSAGQVQIPGNGGFAASSDKLTVNLNGGTLLTMGTGAFGSSTLVLNSSTALADVEFQTPINLGTGSRTLQVDDNANTTFDFATVSGVISGGSSGATLTKTGSGTVILSGSNTYASATVLSSGNLFVRSIGPAGATASNLGTNVGGGSLRLTGGKLFFVGPGETATRNVSLEGDTTIDSSGSGALSLSTVSNGSPSVKTLNLTGSNSNLNAITSTLSDNGGALSITKSDNGNWVLAPATQNNFTGTLSVNGGLLGLTSKGIGTAGITLSGGGIFAYGGALTTSATVQVNNVNIYFAGTNSIGLTGSLLGPTGSNSSNITNSLEAGATLTVAKFVNQYASSSTYTLTIRGVGSTIFSGTIAEGATSPTALSIYTANNATNTLSGASSFTGGVILGQGTLLLNTPSVTTAASALGASSGTLQLTGGELRSNYSLTGTSKLRNSVWLNGDPAVISGTSSIEFGGTLTNYGNTRLLQNNLSSGTLTVSGTINLSEGNVGRNLTVLGNGNTVFSGAVVNGGTSAGNLTYSGAGTLTLTGTSTMTGALTVNRGLVMLKGGSGGTMSGGSYVSIYSSGTLRLDNSAGTTTRLGTTEQVNIIGGVLEVVGLANTTSTISLGSLNASAGAAQIKMASAGTNTLSFTSLSTPTDALLDLTGVSGLGNANKVILGNTSGLMAGSLAQSVITGSEFATYDAVKGFIPYTGYSTADINTLTSLQTGSLTSTGTLLTASRSINGLKLSGTTVSGAGKTLDVTSGGILATGGTSALNVASLTSSASKLLVQVTGGSILEMNGAVVNSAGAFVKAQTGTLRLNAPSFVSNQTSVLAGTLVLNAGLNTLQQGQTLAVALGATLDLNGNTQYIGSLNNGITSGTNNMPDAGGTVTSSTGTGLLVRQGGGQTGFNGQITGSSVTAAIIGGSGQWFRTAETYGGRTVRSGYTLSLENNGSLLNTSAIELNSGGLGLSNNSGLQIQNNDRISDTAPITLRSGAITLTPRVKTDATETIGAVTAALGANALSASSNQGSTELTLASLTRMPGSTVNFIGNGNGTGQPGNNPQILITQDPVQALSGVLGAWAIADTDNFAAYNSLHPLKKH